MDRFTEEFVEGRRGISGLSVCAPGSAYALEMVPSRRPEKAPAGLGFWLEGSFRLEKIVLYQISTPRRQDENETIAHRAVITASYRNLEGAATADRQSRQICFPVAQIGYAPDEREHC
jgi:hypothetical protein